MEFWIKDLYRIKYGIIVKTKDLIDVSGFSDFE